MYQRCTRCARSGAMITVDLFYPGTLGAGRAQVRLLVPSTETSTSKLAAPNLLRYTTLSKCAAIEDKRVVILGAESRTQFSGDSCTEGWRTFVKGFDLAVVCGRSHLPQNKQWFQALLQAGGAPLQCSTSHAVQYKPSFGEQPGRPCLLASAPLDAARL